MTEPLIDRDALRDIVAAYGPVTQAVETTTTTLLAYLRSVLTREALTTVGEWEKEVDGVRWARVVTSDDMHRRIFGENQ